MWNIYTDDAAAHRHIFLQIDSELNPRGPLSFFSPNLVHALYAGGVTYLDFISLRRVFISPRAVAARESLR